MTDEERIVATNGYLERNRIVGFNRVRDGAYPEIRDANPLQKKLLEAWKNPAYKVFAYLGGNRIGKCVTYRTLISTPDGDVPVGMLFKKNKPFKVYAWDGKRRVIADAKAPFKKEGRHKCYRITLSDGRWIEAADEHRVFCSDGQYRSVSMLASLVPSDHPHTSDDGQILFEDSPFLQESSSEHGLSVLPSGAVCLSDRQLDYLQSCFVNRRLCDEQPPSGEDNAPIYFPSQGGVRQHGSVLSCSGDQESRYTSTLRLKYGLPSILDALHLNAGLFFEKLYRNAYSILIPFLQKYQLFQQLAIAEASGFQLNHATAGHQFHGNDTCDTSNMGYNRIISINPIGVKTCYDFEVEKYHNYFAGGLVNHNTTIGAIIAISTVLGEWPWDGVKIPFPHKEPRKVRYVGQAWESHVKAVIEPALKYWWPKDVKVETRKNNQGIEYHWICGSKGSIEIMSNVQDSDVFEGWNGDLVVYDEPPKRNVRVAAARGLIDRNGRELFCMTLLKEAWIHREVIKARLDNGEPDTSVFSINGDIYSNVGYGITREGIEQFAKTLTADEKQARLFGKPSYMSSLVFPKFAREIHVKDAFAIPLDWIVDVSIDFHPSKPWAVVFLATARNGIKYICDELHEHGNPKYIAEQIVRKVKQNNYRIGRVTIDPLSKGDTNNDDTVYERIQQTLSSHYIGLDTASKDKDNGIALVNNLLWTENEMPGLYYFKTCPKSIQQTEDLMYDPDSLKPTAMKVEDDFTECIYRLALMNTQWYPEKIFGVKETGQNMVL